LLPAFAQKFAEHGIAALTFDYRGFGASEGERGRIVPSEQVADIRNALTFLQTRKQVAEERVGLWGTSFGGANAIVAAALDPRVKALVVQLTFAGGKRMVMGDLDEEGLEKLTSTLKKVRERAVTRNKQLMLRPDQILTDEESAAFYVEMVEEYPAIKATKIPFATLQHNIEHNPEEVIGGVTSPVLIIAAGEDTVCPFSEAEALFERAREPKRFVVLEGCRHYEAYAGPCFETGARAAVEWFGSHL